MHVQTNHFHFILNFEGSFIHDGKANHIKMQMMRTLMTVYITIIFWIYIEQNLHAAKGNLFKITNYINGDVTFGDDENEM